jgi:fatty acid-binding protein DegV
MQEIVAQVNALVPCMRVYGILDTLKYVMKGGRLGKAGPIISSILHVKPVLTMKDGTVAPIGAARTRKKAIERLCGLIASVPMVQELGIAHSTTEEELVSFIEKSNPYFPGSNRLYQGWGRRSVFTVGRALSWLVFSRI